ncbi:MAG: chemotaxis protein CheA [Terracidiphilus sp.]|jgi:two-component system chemotaxis sensor kinase CheA
MDNTWIEDVETIREFVAECHENLERLDRDLVELEKHPRDSALLSSVFRTFHTIKGSCGFLAFSHLEQIAHQAETLLSQLRDGKRDLNPELVSMILETVDATRKVLASIDATGREGEERFDDLIQRLQQMAQLPAQPPVASAPAAPAEAPAPAPAPLAATPQATKNDPPAPPPPTPEPAKAAPQAPSPEALQAPAPTPKEAAAAEGSGETAEAKGVPEEEVSRSTSSADANIRVGVVLLDKLMNLVGELVLTRNQILQTNLERQDALLNTSYQRLNLITTELQEHVMKTRMQPIRVVWGNLPRIVRDMAVSLKKQIQLKMDGADTELDRTIIEAIKDPLVHLVRNACDHGIETPELRLAEDKPAEGTMTLRAYHEGGQVTIEIGDDGAGIDVAKVKQKAVQNGLIRREIAENLSDREAINLIFMPGLSTAPSITKISGRGVGMDVVKSQIEKIGGIIDVITHAGEGTTVKIRIPLTLAIIPGLIVTCSGERFVIPQVSLLELIQLDAEAGGKHVEYLHGAPVFRRRGSLLPVVYLNEVLGLPPTEGSEARSMVVLQTEDRQFGLIVDCINDTQEIVVKPLGKQFKGLTLYAGATIMGDGDIALILDVLGIGQSSGVLGENREHTSESKAQGAGSAQEKQRLLLVKSGSFGRIAIPLSLIARLEEFPREAIESASGGHVMQYRDRILPLVLLQSVLEPQAESRFDSMDPVPVIVFNDGDQSIGVVVDEIVDVTEESVSIRQQSRRKGLLGSAVVGKHVTDFLDLAAVIDVSKEKWQHANCNSGQKGTVLLTGRSAFSRGLLRGTLEMSGYVVLEANDRKGAIHLLGSGNIGAVIAVMHDPADFNDSTSLKDQIPVGQPHVPFLAVLDSLDDRDPAKYRTAGFLDCRSLLDRDGIVDALDQILLADAMEPAPAEYAGEVG